MPPIVAPDSIGFAAVRKWELVRLPRRRSCRHVNRGKPIVTVGLSPAGDREEFFLDALRDGAARASTHVNPIDRTDWRDLRGRAAKENFLRNVKHLARNRLLHHRNIQIAASVNHRISRDAAKSRI